jgi:hypothetical protein
MKSPFSKVVLIGIIVAAVTVCFCFATPAAEKKKFTFTKKTEKYLSSVNLHDRTDQKYRITQWSRLDVISEHTDRDLIGAEETVYGQSEYRASMYKGDKLICWGYTVTRNKDGDCYYTNFQSTGIMKKRIDFGLEIEMETKFQIFGGIGKYLDVKGSGVCRGKLTTDSNSEIAKCEGEWEY